nr:MAG TPA: hypothetical protein [Inoviridae sp.]DAY03896.1 MAG TPA: hypothetical protein [Inoviridae sp.]
MGWFFTPPPATWRTFPKEKTFKAPSPERETSIFRAWRLTKHQAKPVTS